MPAPVPIHVPLLVTRPVKVCRAVPVLKVPPLVSVLNVKVSFTVLFHWAPVFIVTAPVKVLAPSTEVLFKIPPVPVPTIVVVDTVKLTPPTIRVPIPPTSSIFRLLHNEATLMVTVNPPPIFTSSKAPGNVPVFIALKYPTVDHVPTAFQLPVARE